ncbi:MAG: osmoprotectant uptake system [Erysipelotrichaceae bacterium]|nr:MAG: osmoprotectant uptake system [Erysipelotrichaceae bacterium]
MKSFRSFVSQFRKWWVIGLYLALFLWWIFDFATIKSLFLEGLGQRPDLIQRTSLAELALQHLNIVFISTSIAIVIGLGLGMIIHYTHLEELKDMALKLASIGETIPSAAIIALSVPLYGYGDRPIILALIIYAILPILRNTIVGLESISKPIIDAAKGVGLSKWQQMIKIELPLSQPTLLAGIRTALVINISAATIGATVGAGGFGVPIIAGIRTYDPVMVIQGSIPVILMALFADRLLRHQTIQKL